MNRHLSDDQISKWALGERSPEALRHAGDCPDCRMQLERDAQALAAFRQSARHWSGQELAAGVPAWGREVAHPRILPLSLRWVCAAAALLLCAGVEEVWRNHRSAPPDRAAADALLLKQIDAGVSQTVPDSMQPLVKLVSWNGSNAPDGSARN